jgi:hypothetical protein
MYVEHHLPSISPLHEASKKREKRGNRRKVQASEKEDGLTLWQQEVLAISDTYVDNTLRAADASQGKWLNEDPSLAQIQQKLMSR